MEVSPKRAKNRATSRPIWHYVAQECPLHLVVHPRYPRFDGTVRARGAGRSALGDVSSREVVEAHLEGFLVWRRGAGLPHHNI